MAAIEMNNTGHFMDDGDDDDVDNIGGCTDDSGANCSKGTGNDDDKYNYPLYMITFPYLQQGLISGITCIKIQCPEMLVQLFSACIAYV